MMLLGIVMAILGRNLALAQGMGVYGSAPDTHTGEDEVALMGF